MPHSEALRALPYKVHTNNELGLMLRGIKPLAVFLGGYDQFPDCLVRYFRCFDRHVAAGALSKHEYVELALIRQLPHVRGWHWIFYVLPGEDWRVDAMIELRARPGAWSTEREWEYGKLLGYEDWQNQVWAERFPYKPSL